MDTNGHSYTGPYVVFTLDEIRAIGKVARVLTVDPWAIIQHKCETAIEMRETTTDPQGRSSL